MKKHQSRKKSIKRALFVRKKNSSDLSLWSLIKKTLNDINVFKDQPPTMYMCGNQSLYLEHYEHIIEYHQQRLKLQLEHMQMTVEGQQLHMEYFSRADIKICGSIEKITFAGCGIQKKQRGGKRT